MTGQQRIEDFDDDFNPFTALLEAGGEWRITDPLTELRRLRAQSPVLEGDLHEHFGLPRQVTLTPEDRPFMILGYKECSEVLLDATKYTASVCEKNLGICFGRSITLMDPPEHTRYRRLFQAAFTPKFLNALRPRFADRLDALISAFEKTGRADLVHDLALHFPFQFICDLLDLPAEDRLLFHKLSAALICITFDKAHSIEASEKLGRYFEGLIEERRALKSETDLISILANAEVEGEELPHEVLLGFLRQLMSAGGDTSYHGFSNILAVLLSNPDQLKAVHDDRALIPQTIEEGIRWGGPITFHERGAINDVELGGTLIPAGATLRVCVASGNHDSTIWPEPERFDIFREHKRHLGFGYGGHVCIGQHLARMELQMTLDALLDRLPNLRLDPDQPPPAIRGLTMRGADAVHVIWDN